MIPNDSSFPIRRTLYVAGGFRIYKSEAVLNGLSIMYSDKTRMLPSHITKFMTDVWRVHPYREGNTRAVSILSN